MSQRFVTCFADIKVIIYSEDPKFDPLVLIVNYDAWMHGEYNHGMGKYINVNDDELLRCIFYYARDFIKGRWSEIEPLILGEASWSFHYANEVIMGRWPEAETIIATSPYWSGCYQKYVTDYKFSVRSRPTLQYDPLRSKQGD